MSFVRWLHHLDQDATLWLNSLNTPFSDGIWQMFSDARVWIPMYAALALLLFARTGWKKALVILASIGLTFACTNELSDIVKSAVLRLRPVWDNYMVEGGLHRLEGRGGWYGFFSAYSANVFGLAAALTMGMRQDRSRSWKNFSWMMYIWAALVAVSRVFVGKHFLGDVLVGAAVGLVAGTLFGCLARWIIGKYL